MSNRAIRCAGCQQENPSDRKFCGQCGGKLWEPCFQCESTNAVDEKFCGGCGTNLAESLQAQEDEIRGKFELAIKFEKAGRYFDASNTLRAISAHGDRRLEKYQENALKMLEQIESRRQSRTEESDKLLAQARTYFKRQRYAKSLESLRAIPVGLRSPEAKKLLEEVERLHQEVQHLTKSIRSAIQSRQHEGLLPRVQRLCELQPYNEEAVGLSERLRHQLQSDNSKRASTLAALAQKKLTAQQYQEAADAVSQIEEAYRKGKIGQLCLQVNEVAWYAQQMQHNTVATPVLQKLALRWKKLIPADPRPERLLLQLSERLKLKPKDARFAIPPWQAAPQATPLGPRVEPWTGITAIDIDMDDESRGELRRHASRMMVAYGLALQAVNGATLKHDLNPKRRGWGGLLKSRKPEVVWGLDIGSTAIKAIQITPAKSGDSMAITGCLVLEHETPLDRATGDAQQAIVAESMERFVEEVGVKKPRVALGFSGRRGLARFFDLPAVKGKKIEEAVGYEMRHQIPLPIEDTVYDFHVWDVPAGDSDFRAVSAIAARREEVEDWVAPVVDAGCELALVQCDGFALYNALHREFLAQQRQDTVGAFVVLDIGRNNSNLIVGERNYVWMRSIVHGTRRWNEAVARDLGLTALQAEKVLRDPSIVRWMHQVDASLTTEFAELVEDLQLSLLAYPRRNEPPMKILLGVGGGFQQFGLLRHLVYGDVNHRVALQK